MLHIWLWIALQAFFFLVLVVFALLNVCFQNSRSAFWALIGMLLRLLLRWIPECKFINLVVIVFWALHSDTRLNLRNTVNLRKAAAFVALVWIWIILGIYFEYVAACLFLMQHRILQKFRTLCWDSLYSVDVLRIVEILLVILEFSCESPQSFCILGRGVAF